MHGEPQYLLTMTTRVLCGHFEGADGKEYEAWLDYETDVPRWSNSLDGDPFPEASRLRSERMINKIRYISSIPDLRYNPMVNEHECLKRYWWASNPDFEGRRAYPTDLSSSKNNEAINRKKSHVIVLPIGKRYASTIASPAVETASVPLLMPGIVSSSSRPYVAARASSVKSESSMDDLYDAGDDNSAPHGSPTEQGHPPAKRQKTAETPEMQSLREKAAKWDELLAIKSFAEIEKLQSSILGFIDELGAIYVDLKTCIAELCTSIGGANMTQADELHEPKFRPCQDLLRELDLTVSKPNFAAFLEELLDFEAWEVVTDLELARKRLVTVISEGCIYQKSCKRKPLADIKARHKGNLRNVPSDRVVECENLEMIITNVEAVLHGLQSSREKYAACEMSDIDTSVQRLERFWKRHGNRRITRDVINHLAKKASMFKRQEHRSLIQGWIDPLEKLVKDMKGRKASAEESFGNLESQVVL